jgi:putative ABC transport system ATP-binding protein
MWQSAVNQGAGKSTLLNIIAGLDTADSGQVMVAGTDLAQLDEPGRTRFAAT